MMQMVKVAVRDTLEKVADAESDTIMDVMNFSREMNAYIKKLST
jgi:hypothetical protein